YQGRSHDFNLFHVWWPAWMIAAILIGLLWREFEARLRLATRIREPAGRPWPIWPAELCFFAGKALFALAAVATWAATVPLLPGTLAGLTPVIPKTSGMVAHRVTTVRRMLRPGERPLVLSGHAGIILNDLQQPQPVDVAGIAEL